MSEPLDPRRPRKTGNVGDEDVYDLAGSETDSDFDEVPSGSETSPLDVETALDRTSQPKPASGPAAPLPRLWKAESEEPEEPASRSQKGTSSGTGTPSKTSGGESRPREKAKSTTPTGGIERSGTVKRQGEKASAPKVEKSRRRTSDEKAGKEGSSGVLLEETPNLDTYAARKTARVIFGVVGLGVIALVGFVVIRSFIPSGTPADNPPTTETAAAPPPNAAAGQEREAEARVMYGRAESLAKNEKIELAMETLTKVTKNYSGTKAARDAQEALDRPKKNLPLFLEGPAVLASKAEAKAKATSETPAPAPAPAPVATATPTTVATTATPTNPVAPQVDPAMPAQSAVPSAKVVSPGAGTPEPSVGLPLPKGFRSKPGTQVDPSGWPIEIVGDRDDSTMLLIPGTSFVMGRDEGEPNERPAHPVKVSTFYIDQHEVTVRQFEHFQKLAGRRAERDSALARESGLPAAADDAPVVMVSAKDARDYAGWAHKKLPTEAQWELAARGPDSRIYPWGLAPPDWGKNREARKITPVMSYSSDVSPYGVYDMAGNAAEWTKDWYDPRFYQLVKGRPQDDPAGPSKMPASQELVIKGGSKNWFVSSREGLRHDKRMKFMGFRCVLAVEGPDSAFEAEKPKTPAAAPIGGDNGLPAGAPPF